MTKYINLSYKPAFYLTKKQQIHPAKERNNTSACTITVQEVLATATRYAKEMRDKLTGRRDTVDGMVTIINNTVLFI